MAAPFFTDGTDIDVGILVEATPGTTPTSGPYEQILYSSISPDYPDEMEESQDRGDHGGPRGQRTKSRGGNLDLGYHWRYGLNTTLEEAALRDDTSAAVTITGTSDLNIIVNGTDADGTTSATQITGPTGTFDDLITLKGATLNGAGGLLLKMSAWATAANNQFALIKNVRDTGSLAIIELHKAYYSGSSGDPVAAPKTAETGKSAVLSVGTVLRNMRKGTPARNTFSIMLDRYMMATAARFRTVYGWVAGDWTLEMQGKGAVICNVTGMGRGWSASSMTPQNGQSVGSHFTVQTSLRDFLIGGKDLLWLTLGTQRNALVATSLPIILSDLCVNSFTLSEAGNVNVLNNIVGTDSVVPHRSRHGFSGSLNYYVGDHATYEKLEALGAGTTHQKASVAAMWQDPDGNYKAVVVNKAEFGQTGGGAGDGAEEGTLNFAPETGGVVTRALAIQEWAAA